jgi:hypothetical protein
LLAGALVRGKPGVMHPSGFGQHHKQLPKLRQRPQNINERSRQRSKVAEERSDQLITLKK